MTSEYPTDEALMGIALEEARLAEAHGDVPVGALVVVDGRIVARRHNEREATNDPTAHAELLAVRDAAEALGSWRLEGATVVVTLEPCPMCAAAISNARIGRLYYGASDPKSGGVAQGPRVFSHAQCHHKPEVYDGIGAAASEALIRDFFANRRI